jgi:endogenous inhibitor of DNA gyrase (YacG/DUF329 family)
MASQDPPVARGRRCPICGDKTEAAYRPFCSARCRDIDLARWLGGGYAIAGGEVEADEDGDATAPEPGAGQGRGGKDERD